MEIKTNHINWEYLSEDGRKWLSSLEMDRIQAKPFKLSMHRGVYYISEGLYIKIFRYGGIRAIIKRIKGGKACKEGQIALELKKRGINAPIVLAFGKRQTCLKLRNDLLITNEINDSKTLGEFIRDSFPFLIPRKKRMAIKHFSLFIYQLHSAGILHKDLNSANILIKESPKKYEFYLIDLDKVELRKKALSHNEQIENLGRVLRMLWTFTTLSQRFRFLKYYDYISDNITNSNHLNAIRNIALTFYFEKGKRIARQCRSTHAKFKKEKIGCYTVRRIKNGQTNKLITHLLNGPDLMLQKGTNVNKKNNITTAVVEINGTRYLMKKYSYCGLRSQLKNTLSHSLAIRTWMTTFQFLLRKISVPSPFICIEKKILGIVKCSYILSEYIENAMTLSEALNLKSHSENKNLLSKISINIGWMHQVGCLHGDLRKNNILIERNHPISHVYFVHMDNSKVFRQLAFKTAKNDFSSFVSELFESEPKNEIRKLENIWEKWFEFAPPTRLS